MFTSSRQADGLVISLYFALTLILTFPLSDVLRLSFLSKFGGIDLCLRTSTLTRDWEWK